jgi:hypothetical protein
MSCHRLVNLDPQRRWTLSTASGLSQNVGAQPLESAPL